jgi:hypothetical protein
MEDAMRTWIPALLASLPAVGLVSPAAAQFCNGAGYFYGAPPAYAYAAYAPAVGCGGAPLYGYAAYAPAYNYYAPFTAAFAAPVVTAPVTAAYYAAPAYGYAAYTPAVYGAYYAAPTYGYAYRYRPPISRAYYAPAAYAYTAPRPRFYRPRRHMTIHINGGYRLAK